MEHWFSLPLAHSVNKLYSQKLWCERADAEDTEFDPLPP